MKFRDISLLKRKNFVILSLVMMLGLIGYINYNLNKESLLKTSSELESYEMRMMEESGVLREILGEDEYELGEADPEEINEEPESTDKTEESDETEEQDVSLNELVSEKVEGEMDNAIIVDSRDNSVMDVAQETNAQISATITSQQIMKSNIYFIESKLERDKKRSEMISYLDDIVNNQYTSEDQRNQALDMKMNVIGNSDKELLIENMVMAKGFNDVVVFISGDSINVVVQSEGLNEKEVAQIVDIVRRETDIPMDNIIIMNKK
ncbi:SpoIIIAH-like family protein [Alkaliphilus crotonatoxidans]